MTGGEMEIRQTTGRIPFKREEDEIHSKTGDFRLRKKKKKKWKTAHFDWKLYIWSPDFAAAFWNACKISLFRKGITYVAFTLWTHFQAHSQPRHIANRLDKYDLGTNGKQTNSRTEKKSKKQPYKNGLVNKLLTNMLVVNLPATVVHQLVLYQ